MVKDGEIIDLGFRPGRVFSTIHREYYLDSRELELDKDDFVKITINYNLENGFCKIIVTDTELGVIDDPLFVGYCYTVDDIEEELMKFNEKY